MMTGGDTVYTLFEKQEVIMHIEHVPITYIYILYMRETFSFSIIYPYAHYRFGLAI